MYISNHLQNTLFREFQAQQLDELGSIFELRRYTTLQVILRQNDPATHIYIVVDGVVEIRHLPYDGPTLKVDRLSEGDVFGWSALLGRDTYSATVVAEKDSSVCCCTTANLQQLCRHHHDTGVVLLEKIARSVSQRPDEKFEAVMKVLGRMMNCETTH